MFEAEARIATIDGSRYLTEIAKAWVHTYPVRYDALTAEIELPGGQLIMTDRVAEHDTGVRCVWHEIS